MAVETMGSYEELTRSHERELIESARAQEAEGNGNRFGRRAVNHSERSPADLPPDLFGGYTIIREFHRGGQGVVYEAVQTGTQRRVAIKVLREGPFAGVRDKARFEREIEVLGQIKHPNIVTIHHAGRTHGCVYFVMDFIAGEPLDMYVKDAGLPLRETLRLFSQVCQAVHSAHLHGVIHRDLKPGNIRIDPQGEPRILDFGLAKIAGDPTGASKDGHRMTATGQFIGSLPWASPEQAAGVPADIDLRTDIYSLGVILYRLITGEFPYPVIGSMRDVLANIMESDPVRPSSISRNFIDADVETIALKCLAKEPARRYQSAAELAEDLDRYLSNQPILARAPTAMYQLRKLIERNKLVFGVTCTLFVLVTAVAIWMSVLYAHAESQRRRATAAEAEANQERIEAHQQAERAEAVSEFLIKDMLANAQPQFGRGRAVTVEEVLRNAAARIETTFIGKPLLEASIRGAIGESYVSLGLYESARPHLQAAADLYVEHLGALDPKAFAAQNALIDVLYLTGAYADAIPLSETAFKQCQDHLGFNHEIALEAAFQRARLYWIEGNLDASKEMHLRVLDARRHILGSGHPDSLASLNQWGIQGITGLTPTPSYLQLLEETLQTGHRTLGDDHPEMLRVKGNMGRALMVVRALERAEPLLEEAFEGHRLVFGPEHADTLQCMVHLALLRKEQDRLDDADSLYTQAHDIAVKTLGVHHPRTRDVLQLHAFAQMRHGEYVEAADSFHLSLELERNGKVIRRGDLAQALFGLSNALEAMGRHSEAEQHLRQGIDLRLGVSGNEYASSAWSFRCLVRILVHQGKTEEAKPFAEELLERRRHVAYTPDADAYQLNCCARELLEVFPEDLRNPQEALQLAQKAYELSTDAYHYNRYTLARAYEANGQLQKAIEIVRLALDHIPIEYSTERADYEAALVRMLKNSGDDRAAEDVYRKTLELRRAQFPFGHPDTAESLTRLGETLIRHGRFEEAESHVREAVQIRENALSEGDWQIGEAVSLLGAALAGQSRSEEAEPLLAEGFTILVESPMAYSDQTKQALKRIEDFLQNTGRSQEFPHYAAKLPAP